MLAGNWSDFHWGLICLGVIIAAPLGWWAWLEHHLNRSKTSLISVLEEHIASLSDENDTLRQLAVKD